MNRAVLIILLSLGALALYGVYLVIEPYEETIDTGWGDEARLNPYLAMEQFMARMGVDDVVSGTNYDQLESLPEQGMVFISRTGAVLTEQRVDEVVHWIERGGRLVVGAQSHHASRADPLLTRFNVDVEAIDYGDDDWEQKKLSDALQEMNEKIREGIDITEDVAEVPDKAKTPLSFNGLDEDLMAHFDAGVVLKHPYILGEDYDTEKDYVPTYWSGDEYGTHIMLFEIGDGLITVMSDSSIWQSHRIDEQDHAWFLWLLADDPRELVILYGAVMPSLFELIWEYAPEVVITLSLWLVAWLAYRSHRFGAVIGTSGGASRSMAEHITASAAYQSRNGFYPYLIEVVRKDMNRRLTRYLPTYHNLRDTQKLELVTEYTGLDSEAVWSALFDRDIYDRQSFTRAIRNSRAITASLKQ